MAHENKQQGVTRRDALRVTGAAAATSLGVGTVSAQGKPSYHAEVPEANLEMGTMAHLTAVRELMPENTNDRMTAEVERFENVRLMLTALNAGSIDTYTNAPANLYFAQAAGNDYRIVGPKVMGTDYYIVGHKEKAPTLKSFVKRPQELTFAINQKGNIDHLQVVGVYSEEGMDFSKATTVNVGGSSARIKAFLAGRADGFTCHIEQFERLKSQGEPVKLLAKVSNYFPNFVQSCLAVPTQKLNDKAFDAWTQAYVTSVLQANKRAMNDFEWVFKKTQKYQAKPLDKETARSTWEVLVNDMNAWKHKSFKKKPFKSVHDMLVESGQLKSEVDIDKMFEKKYFEQAQDQL